VKPQPVSPQLSPMVSSPGPATVATIDLSALAHNLAQVRQRIPATCNILGVVKANAYGHGAVEVSRTLVQSGAHGLGVGTLTEGLQLRQAHIQAPILVMGALTPEEGGEAISQGLTPVLYDPVQTAALAKCVASSKAGPCGIHIKVDTGMGRMGIRPDQVSTVLQSDPFRRCFRVEGVMTHFADADNPDPTYTQNQIERFQDVMKKIESTVSPSGLVHSANSAAILLHSQSHGTAVRPGIMLYGYHTLSEPPQDLALKPVMSLTTRVAQIRVLNKGECVSYNRTFTAKKPTRIAVLPVGYADGYNRLLSNKGHVLIKGQQAQIVGRICMDMTMVEVTDIPDVHPGEEVVLIGQQGTQSITAQDLATMLGTISYEVLCAIGPRVPRIYIQPS